MITPMSQCAFGAPANQVRREILSFLPKDNRIVANLARASTLKRLPASEHLAHLRV